MAKISVCAACTLMGTACEFPEDSEQCVQCRNSVRRCESRWSDEDYRRVKDEIQKVEHEMDIKIAGTINQLDNFRRLKEQLQLLEENKQLAEGELDKSTRRRRKT